uniref:Uncharacterized protein n=1 Tax=viral metagenome TaxID=1070528 RepID=A0A6C0H3M6_9ZZZZ
MQQLCEKLCKFYNANILDDQTYEIYNGFHKASSDNIGTGHGKQTLMKLILNHFRGDPEPRPEFIGGPKNLTVHWSDKYEKMIYIFGEYHSAIIDCDEGDMDIPDAKKMSIEYFLGELIRTTDKYLDIFIEIPMLSNKETKKYHNNFLPLEKDSRLSKLFEKFKECVEYNTRDGDRCKLARVHYFDIRKKEDMEGFSEGTDIISYFLIEIQYLFNNALHFEKSYKELEIDITVRIESDKQIMSVLNGLRQLNTTKFNKFWTSPLRDNIYIKKELNKLDPEMKQLIVDYVDKEIIRRATRIRSEWEKDTTLIFSTSKDEFEFCRAVKRILHSVHHVYSGVIDAYLLARMFKKFKLKEKADQPDTARNIIIYGGLSHAEIVRRFLKYVLNFDDIASSGEREIRIETGGKETTCVDMKSIKYPLFEYPKKQVLVLCQRSEGFNEKISIKDRLIPTLEKIINTFLKEKIGNDIADIKYMVDLDPTKKQDKADFNMVLANHSKKGRAFRDQHLDFYDLVVLQTCPFLYMDMKMVNDILKDYGYLICTTVLLNGKSNKIILEPLVKKITDAGFTEVTDRFLTFQKKASIPDPKILVEKLILGGQNLSIDDRNAINKIIQKNIDFKNLSLLKQDYTNQVHRGMVIVLLLLSKNNPCSPFFPIEKRPENHEYAVVTKKLEDNFIQSFASTQ